jgi:hypothetical protein
MLSSNQKAPESPSQHTKVTPRQATARHAFITRFKQTGEVVERNLESAGCQGDCSPDRFLNRKGFFRWYLIQRDSRMDSDIATPKAKDFAEVPQVHPVSLQYG